MQIQEWIFPEDLVNVSSMNQDTLIKASLMLGFGAKKIIKFIHVALLSGCDLTKRSIFMQYLSSTCTLFVQYMSSIDWTYTGQILRR